MPALSFRIKLLLAMMLVVAGVTGATLFATQQRVQAVYRRLFEAQFRTQLDASTTLQEVRLTNVKLRCLDLARLVRMGALVRRLNMDLEKSEKADADETREKLYQTGLDQLNLAGVLKRESIGTNFFRLLDVKGKVVPPPIDAGLTNLYAEKRLRELFALVSRGLTRPDEQQVGYLAPIDAEGRKFLAEVVFTKIIDRNTGEQLGALVLGFLVPDSIRDNSGTQAPDTLAQFKSGIWLEDQLYGSAIAQAVRLEITQPLAAAMRRASQSKGDFIMDISGAAHRVFYGLLNVGLDFPTVYQVGFYSLKEAQQEQKALRMVILGFGGVALLGALAVSTLLSHGLVVPIRELVKGTGEIQRGNFAVKVPVRTRDEIGRLAVSFNEMADGLAQKEKYRNVLNMVSDEKIAHQLMSGQVSLGGERRVISVLFCDIRGFTALTENMPEKEVIEMLNEHMTVLTRVVKEHNGVVDKFVGDLIMAIFGAPVSHDQDARSAAQCALRMIHERQDLNQTSRYKIRIGIGLATGAAIAGCMGSRDRLNYTVVGKRVNLASRLCSKAAPMQVVIDESTRELLGDEAHVELLPPLDLKGFSEPVPAYQLIELRAAHVNA
jgi:class 3 adenylate cyclase